MTGGEILAILQWHSTALHRRRLDSFPNPNLDHGLLVSIENGFSVDVVMHYVKSIGNAHVAPALGRENSK